MISALQWKRLHQSILSKLPHRLSALGSKYWLNWLTPILNFKLQLVGANLAPTTYGITRIGWRSAIINLLGDQRVQEAKPRGHSPTQDTDTVDWSEPTPGNMRADYVLPSVEWTITDGGVVWPKPSDQLVDVAKTASHHHLVWVDITR